MFKNKQNTTHFLALICLAFASLMVGCADSRVVILKGVAQSTVNDVVLDLSKHKIQAYETFNTKEGTYDIAVSSSDQVEALQVLSNAGEPGHKYTNLGEVFKKDGLISSPLEEYARYLYALDQDLEETISLIDGTLDVKVHVSLPVPSDSLWSSESIKPSAAVFIKYKSGYRIDLLTNRIKLLVSKAVPGLSPDMVEVFPMQRKEGP